MSKYFNTNIRIDDEYPIELFVKSALKLVESLSQVKFFPFIIKP